MRIVPIFQKAANKFVNEIHRHHDPVVGSIFQIGVEDKMRGPFEYELFRHELIGVAICGRPVASKTDYTTVIEVNRCCVKEGCPNACSMLYGACARIAREMGYLSIITFTLEREPGTSLKASGWICEGLVAKKKGQNHGSKNRVRSHVKNTLFGEVEKYPDEPTVRWRKILNPLNS